MRKEHCNPNARGYDKITLHLWLSQWDQVHG